MLLLKKTTATKTNSPRQWRFSDLGHGRQTVSKWKIRSVCGHLWQHKLCIKLLCVHVKIQISLWILYSGSVFHSCCCHLPDNQGRSKAVPTDNTISMEFSVLVQLHINNILTKWQTSVLVSWQWREQLFIEKIRK